MFDFGNRLAEERKRLRYNQTDFGRIGGVTKTSQFNYEAGERSPNVEYWQAVARAGVDVRYVLTGVRDVEYLPQCPNRHMAIAEQRPINHQEHKLLEMFNLLDDQGKAWAFGVLAERLRMMELQQKVEELTRKTL